MSLRPCPPHPGMEQGCCALDAQGPGPWGRLGSQGLSRPRPMRVRGPRGSGWHALAGPLWSVPSLSSPGCCVGGKSGTAGVAAKAMEEVSAGGWNLMS